ncbi:MAG TPA: radical SAM family heme chaperone HemW [Bryobacteraceae bacterium]|nr:radical SAM family heme chaperone HemW [Bryobacteraceae bacterium]
MAGVYVSFPFCAQKCTYCNFASGVFPKELEEQYAAALLGEIRAHSWAWTPETVYLGGGTPSRVAPETLSDWLAAIPGRPWREATIEVAPGDVSLEKAEGWKSAGIHRVSLGVQSFVSRELSQTGRKHTAETVAREVEVLRSAGIDNINLDLIAGLPHQTVGSFAGSLDWIERLGVPHVSVYMLEVDEDSRLGGEILLGGVKYGASKQPTDDAIVEMYECAVSRLRQMGVSRYEISNFARPGFESRHNLKYWRLEPYAGFGSDAHSFDGAVRRKNAETPAAYVERWNRGESVCVEENAAVLYEERFLVGLRLSAGITVNDEDWSRFSKPIERFLDQGLLEREDGRLRFTRQGVLYSNEVLQEFIDA